jgi:hypothetical protein
VAKIDTSISVGAQGEVGDKRRAVFNFLARDFAMKASTKIMLGGACRLPAAR